jgi:hypothetical protein
LVLTKGKVGAKLSGIEIAYSRYCYCILLLAITMKRGVLLAFVWLLVAIIALAAECSIGSNTPLL